MYEQLALAIIKQAAADLDVVYNKVKTWAEIDAVGELELYAITKPPQQTRLTKDDLSALAFWRGSSAYYLCLAMLNLETLPPEAHAWVSQRVQFVEDAGLRLASKIQHMRGRAATGKIAESDQYKCMFE